MAAKHSRTSWSQGVGTTSAGRLGAHAAGYEPPENGFLTLRSDGETIRWIDDESIDIGALHLPPTHTRHSHTQSWVLRTTEISAPGQDGFPNLKLRTVLSAARPDVVFDSSTDRMLRWRWPVQGSPGWIALPTANGLELVNYARGYPLKPGHPAAALFFGSGAIPASNPDSVRWSQKWMVTFGLTGKPRPCPPLLWVFHGPKPRKVDVISYEFMNLQFSSPFGRISVMPLSGTAAVDHDALRGLCEGKGREPFAAWCNHWADLLRRLPDDVQDQYRIDEEAGVVHVRQSGSRLDGKKPSRAPVPPFLSAAETRYPVEFATPMVEPPAGFGELYSHYGPYRIARSSELQYSIPLCPYLPKVLCPKEIMGDSEASNITRRLRKKMDDPAQTYGGDGTWDADSLLDILHNLRVLAWAAWSLPQADRETVRAGLVRDFPRLFRKSSYLYYTEPVTGRRFCRDPEIFDWCGDVTYDMDWYSGMNLAGLFAGVYFDALEPATVRRQWSLTKDIAAYFEVYQDWATFAPWTDMRGEVLNFDCARHGAQGMIGLARLAETFGDADTRDRARYIASRYMVLWAAELALPELFHTGGVPTNPTGRSGPGRLDIGLGNDLRERNAAIHIVTSGASHPYTLSPLTPEHMLFFRDYADLEHFEEYERNALGEDCPHWQSSPHKTLRSDDPEYVHERISGQCFYQTDPHYFLRLLVLDWPVAEALEGEEDPSPQVLAAALARIGPMVLAPATVRFMGCRWDAKARVLEIEAERPIGGKKKRLQHESVAWEILFDEEPREIQGPDDAETNFHDGRLTLRTAANGTLTWRVRY